MFLSGASGSVAELQAWARGSKYESDLTPFDEQSQEELMPFGQLTSRHQLVDELRHRLDEASRLLRMARDLGSMLELEALYALVFDQLEEATSYTSCTLYGREGKELRALAHRGPRPASAVVGHLLPVAVTQVLLGDLIRVAPEPQLVHDQRALAFFQAHLDARVWLRLPLLVASQPVGLLLVGHDTSNHFQATDSDFLSALAGHIAPALGRTQRYHLLAQTAAAEERQRLARELHDSVSQTLFSATLIADALPEVWESAPEKGRSGLQELSRLTHDALAELRTLLLELRPATFSVKPLGELLRPLCAAFTNRTGLPVILKIQGKIDMPAKVQISLYRITQEALNNILKYAQATKVTVTLACVADQVVLTIGDDGVGFDHAQLTPDRLGLAIMRERCESLGAHFSLESAPNRGVQIQVTCCAKY